MDEEGRLHFVEVVVSLRLDDGACRDVTKVFRRARAITDAECHMPEPWVRKRGTAAVLDYHKQKLSKHRRTS